MSIVHRVLASTRKGLSSSPLIPKNVLNLQQPFCSYESSCSNLVQRLKKEPNSHIKAILDSEGNHVLKSFDFSWHSFVSALCSSSPSKAHKVLEWRLGKMQEDDERNQELYAEMISLCGESRNLELAMRVFMAMETAGVKPTSNVFNSLILASLTMGNEMTALSLFEIMERSEDCKPNSKSYNAFISIYSKWGKAKAMQAWASAKAAAGFVVDLQSYESLISGYVNAKSFDVAERYYEEMISSGIIPSRHILNKMVDGLCGQRNIGRAKEFLLNIIDNGWAVSTHIANRLVGLYTGLEKVEDIEELLRILRMSNQSSEVLSRVHCGVISMHAMADRLDDVEYAVGRMLKEGISFNSADDINVIICSYFRQAAYDRLQLVLEHIKGSYQLTKSTYELLIAGYRNAGLSEKLDSLLKDMNFCNIS